MVCQRSRTSKPLCSSLRSKRREVEVLLGRGFFFVFIPFILLLCVRVSVDAADNAQKKPGIPVLSKINMSLYPLHRVTQYWFVVTISQRAHGPSSIISSCLRGLCGHVLGFCRKTLGTQTHPIPASSPDTLVMTHIEAHNIEVGVFINGGTPKWIVYMGKSPSRNG